MSLLALDAGIPIIIKKQTSHLQHPTQTQYNQGAAFLSRPKLHLPAFFQRPKIR